MSPAVTYPLLLGVIAVALIVLGAMHSDPVALLTASGLFFTASWMFSRHRQDSRD